jgi:hypothetical protein
MTKRYVEYLSDETDMDVDTASPSFSTAAESREETEDIESGSGDEDSEKEDDEGEDESSSKYCYRYSILFINDCIFCDIADDHLLHIASPKQLARLRKPDLVRLYIIAGLPDDAELLTKHEIIDCLISAREDYASLPPSSPIGRNDGSSSGSLSDDGNVAGDEETDVAPVDPPALNETMRRRVTVQDFGAVNGRVPKGRSMSMGNLINREDPTAGQGHSQKDSAEIRGELNRSSTSK